MSATRTPIGVEVLDNPVAFVDVAKRSRPFTAFDGVTATPIDADGWPATDGQVVLFDHRPIPAWDPPVDDPLLFQPDMSGRYHLSFQGKAILSNAGALHVAITNHRYEASTNTSTAEVTLPKHSPALLILRFASTCRTPGSAVNSGITRLKCIRPGYPPDTARVFDTPFPNALRPFAYLRFMEWMRTNYHSDRQLLRWIDRVLPSDACQDFGSALRPGAMGVAWEYVIALANELKKDIWVNIPISASGNDPNDRDSYVHQLALLFRRELRMDLNIYVEHSNEVWCDEFPQLNWNRQVAIEEVRDGGSPLNNDGCPDEGVWTRRRHAKRLYEIAKIFEVVFGEGSLNGRVRPVHAWWYLHPGEFRDVLAWMNDTFGPPKDYFHAIAHSAYFADTAAAPDATSDEVLAAMREDSDSRAAHTREIHAIAEEFGLQHTCYEGGPDSGGGGTVNIANRIQANRADAMNELVQRHIRANWFPHGPESFTYFGLSTAYSRYGCFGATDDYRDTRTAKMQALHSLLLEGV